jgi:hypothetical protein
MASQDNNSTQREMLIRIDERTKSLIKRFDDFEKKQSDDFVTRIEFEPIKRLVYGVVGLVLTGFVLAIIALVIPR